MTELMSQHSVLLLSSRRPTNRQTARRVIHKTCRRGRKCTKERKRTDNGWTGFSKCTYKLIHYRRDSVVMGCIQAARTRGEKKERSNSRWPGAFSSWLLACFLFLCSSLNRDAGGMEPCQWADWISKCYFTTHREGDGVAAGCVGLKL